MSIKTFTPSEFRSDTSKVYNEVMINGMVSIQHRDRPQMVLMTQEKYDELIYQILKGGKSEQKGQK